MASSNILRTLDLEIFTYFFSIGMQFQLSSGMFQRVNPNFQLISKISSMLYAFKSLTFFPIHKRSRDKEFIFSLVIWNNSILEFHILNIMTISRITPSRVNQLSNVGSEFPKEITIQLPILEYRPRCRKWDNAST